MLAFDNGSIGQLGEPVEQSRHDTIEEVGLAGDSRTSDLAVVRSADLAH